MRLCFSDVWGWVNNNILTDAVMAVIIARPSQRPIRETLFVEDLIKTHSLPFSCVCSQLALPCTCALALQLTRSERGGTQVLKCFYCLCREEGWESEGRWPGGGSEAGAVLGRSPSGGFSHCLSLPTLLLLFYPLPQHCFHFPFLSV